MRIGSLWIGEKDGERTRTGIIDPVAGINLPAGQVLGVSIVPNERKETDKSPDFFLEVWPRTKGREPEQRRPASGANQDGF